MNLNQVFADIGSADLPHRLAKLISVGTIAEVDYQTARVKVKIGDWLTGWLPWLTARASNNLNWQAPEIDEQVLVLAPCGDIAQAVVLGAVYQQQQQELVSDIPAEERQEIERMQYLDGSVVEYNRKSHRYFMDIKGENATLDIVSAGTLNINTVQDITVVTEANARVTATENIEFEAKSVNVKASENISLDAGKDVSVKAGGNMTLEAGGNMKLNASHISAQE